MLPPGTYYNKYFPGNAIGMPQPLHDGQVQYTDGTPKTLDQYGRDVAAFLMWAAEPKLDERKRLGFQVMIFLIVFTGLLYFTKKKVWHGDVEHVGVETAVAVAAEDRRCRRSTSKRPVPHHDEAVVAERAAISAVTSMSRKPTTIAAGMAASAALMKNITRRKKGMRRSTMTKRWASRSWQVLRLRRPPWFARVRPRCKPT